MIDPSEIILLVPEDSSNVLRPQCNILTPGDIRENTLLFVQLRFPCHLGAESPIRFTEQSEKLPTDSQLLVSLMFAFTLPLFRGMQVKSQIYNVFRGR